jgi:asparagine synthetase B (glutamine-hydrolysing)
VGLESAVPRRSEPSLWNQEGEYASFWTSHMQGGLPALGWRERNAAAAESVEFRSPFWDLRVMELLGSMPSWVHRSAGQPKALLRAAMKPRLPQEIVERRNKGVFDELMDQGIEAEAGRIEASLDGPLSRLLYVNTEILRDETRRYRSMRHRWWHPVWRAFTGGLWLLAEEGLSDPQVAGVGTPTRRAAESGVPRSRT